MLEVRVNSHGHVATLPLFYGSFSNTQNWDVITFKILLQILTPVQATKYYMCGWFDLESSFLGQAQT